MIVSGPHDFCLLAPLPYDGRVLLVRVHGGTVLVHRSLVSESWALVSGVVIASVVRLGVSEESMTVHMHGAHCKGK